MDEPNVPPGAADHRHGAALVAAVERRERHALARRRPGGGRRRAAGRAHDGDRRGGKQHLKVRVRG